MDGALLALGRAALVIAEIRQRPLPRRKRLVSLLFKALNKLGRGFRQLDLQDLGRLGLGFGIHLG